MRKTHEETARDRGRSRIGGAGDRRLRRQAKYVFALVPKNMNNPFFDQARDGCKKAEKPSPNGAFECMYIGPGEHGGGDEQVADRAGPDRQEGRRHRRVARRTRPPWREALQAAKEAGIPVLTWDSDLLREGQGPARRLYRHPQLRDRHQPRQARAGDQAEGRHDLHPVRRRRGGQPQRAHAGHPRHARRAPRAPRLARRPPDRPERLDRGRRLPALHRRRLPARRCSRSRTSWQVSRTSTPSSRPAASRSSCRTPTAQRSPRSTRTRSQRRIAGARRRRHAARPDRADEGRPVARPGRPASVRDGLQDHDVR